MTKRMVRRTWQRLTKISAALSSIRNFRAALQGTFPSVELHQLLPRIRVATVLDGGANRGQFYLLARHSYPSSAIHCFEPLPSAQAILTKVISGDKLAVAHGIALGATTGHSRINVTQKNDSSSLKLPTKLQEHHDPKSRVVARSVVPVEALDDWSAGRILDSPVLLKLDVQGGELDALRGARTLLAKVQFVLVESSFREFYHGQELFEQVHAFLANAGFRFVAARPSWVAQDGAWEQADILYRKHHV